MGELVVPDPGAARDLAPEMNYEGTVNPGLVGTDKKPGINTDAPAGVSVPFDQTNAGYSGSAMGSDAPVVATPPLADDIPDAYIWGGDKLHGGWQNVEGAS